MCVLKPRAHHFNITHDMIKWSCLNMCGSAVGTFTGTQKKTRTKNAPTPPIRTRTHTHTHTHTLYTHAQSRRDLQGESSRHPLFNTRLRESSWWETGVRQLKWLPGSPPCHSSILFYPLPCLQLHKLSSLLREARGKKHAVAEAKIITLQNSALQPLVHTQQASGERPLLLMHNPECDLKS